MTIELWLQNAITKLKSVSVPTARLDAEILLADLTDKDRTWIHAHPEYVLHRSDLSKLDAQVKRRMSHEPLAYIRGRQEFYGRDFIVSPDTLTPRPETETLVELALEVLKSKANNEEVQIIDIGTGSGCIIITVALETQHANCLGLDVSEPALKIAKKNNRELVANVVFKNFDLLSDTLELKSSSFNLVLANLPYVPNDFEINLAASHEPGFAIFGGDDGLDYYRKLFTQLSRIHRAVPTVITEALPPQHNELEKIAESNGFKLTKTKDFIQVFEKKLVK